MCVFICNIIRFYFLLIQKRILSTNTFRRMQICNKKLKIVNTINEDLELS